MKKSIFTSLIPVSNKHSLLYNALSDTFLILSNKLKSVWENESIEKMSLHSTFYKLLLKGKYIVDENIDEFEYLKTQVNEIICDKKDFHLIINPTLNCNFKCWYCYETHTVSKMSEETFERVQKFIGNKVKQSFLKHFHLSFFGGEPLIYFKDIVSKLLEFTYKECLLNDKKFSFSFTSNGVLIDDFCISTMQKYSDSRISFQITLDGCKEDHDKVRFVSESKGSYDRIMNNIEKLLENHIYVILRINFTTQNIHKVNKILDDLRKPIFINNKYLTVNFQQVWQDSTSSVDITDIVDETISLFRENNIKVLYHNSDFIRNPCYADKKNEAIINYNGNVYKCTAVDFERTEKYGFLDAKGEIVWRNDKIEKRFKSILKNTLCHKCRIAPICGGGCTERTMEKSDKEYCLLNNDEVLKDKLILYKFENKFL